MRFGDDLLAAFARVAAGRRLAAPARGAAGQAARGRPDRLVTRGGRFVVSAGVKGGAKTGPSPVNRRKPGCKHHLIVDGRGIPLAAILTAANRPDASELLNLLDAIPPVRGKPGAPKRRPERLLADGAYYVNRVLDGLELRRVEAQIARRRREHGSGLGRQRWVVERTISWLHQHRRLRLRYERRPDIHEAFLSIACSLICHRALQGAF